MYSKFLLCFLNFVTCIKFDNYLVVFSVFWVFCGCFSWFFIFPVLLSFVYSLNACLMIFLCFATKKISLIILCLFTLGICKLYIYICIYNFNFFTFLSCTVS